MLYTATQQKLSTRLSMHATRYVSKDRVGGEETERVRQEVEKREWKCKRGINYKEKQVYIQFCQPQMAQSMDFSNPKEIPHGGLKLTQ